MVVYISKDSMHEERFQEEPKKSELSNKKKTKKKTPSSPIRTSDLRMSTTLLQSSALPTELLKEDLRNFVFEGNTLFHENRWQLRVFTKFDDSFLFEREQEDEFHRISQNQIKIVLYTKILQKGLEYVARELSVMLTK